MSDKNKIVAVIGAGIAGLAAAYTLKKAGIPYTVFELNAYPGGRMKTTIQDDFSFDGGADFFAANYTQMHAFADELGIEWLPTLPRGSHRIIRDGIPHRINMRGALDVLRFSMISFRARLYFLKWLAEIRMASFEPSFFDLSKLPESLDFDNAAHYLNERVSSEITDYVADPFTGIMQFHRSDEISTAALWSLVKMMITPSLHFHIRFTPGGIGAIPAALAREVGVEYGAEIARVTRTPKGVRVTRASGHEETFRAAILATPAPITRILLENPLPEEAALFSAARYAATMTIAYRTPPDLFPDGAHLTYVPFVENETVSGYANEGRKSKPNALSDHTLLNVYLHERIAIKLMPEDEARIFEIVKDELFTVCPEVRERFDEIKPHAIERWKLAMPKFDHGYIKIVRNFVRLTQGSDGIYLAGDYLNAPWTEGAARSGVRAAKAVIAMCSKSQNP